MRLARLALVAVGVVAGAHGGARADSAPADGHGAAATDRARGEAVLARARAVERAQLAALAGTTLTMRTEGVVRNGRALHTLSAERRLAVTSDGRIENEFVWGKLDGKSLGEGELRQATGAPPKPAGQAEALTVALAPLGASDIDVTPVGPLPDGGYRLRCRVRRSAAVDLIDLVVDEASGKKRAAALRPAGTLVRLADRAELRLVYGEDGAPVELRSDFAARVLWVDRAAELRTTRVAAVKR
jgi:hypothetical protein